MDIYDFIIDDVNEEEFAQHRVTVVEVLQVLDGPFKVFRNRGPENAPYVIVGPTHGGRVLKIPIDPSVIPTAWRRVLLSLHRRQMRSDIGTDE